MATGDAEIEGIAPSGQESCQFRVARSLLDRIWRDGPEHKAYEVWNVKDTLQKPTAVFEGLNRDNFKASYCYVGNPEEGYSNDGERRPWDPRFVFLVYVRDDLRVLDWEKAKADEQNPKLPQDWKSRFERPKWIR